MSAGRRTFRAIKPFEHSIDIGFSTVASSAGQPELGKYEHRLNGDLELFTRHEIATSVRSAVARAANAGPSCGREPADYAFEDPWSGFTTRNLLAKREPPLVRVCRASLELSGYVHLLSEVPTRTLRRNITQGAQGEGVADTQPRTDRFGAMEAERFGNCATT